MIKHTRYSGIHVSLGDMVSEETKPEHEYDDHIPTMAHWVNTEKVIVVHRDHTISVFEVVQLPNRTEVQRGTRKHELTTLPYGGEPCGDLHEPGCDEDHHPDAVCNPERG
jgi:hypothetical protein